MKRLIYNFTFISIFLFLINNQILAQENKKFNFVGINPSITVEPFYEKGELDINIFPLIYQRCLTKRLDVRLASTLNLGIRNTGNKISHLGFEAGLPIYFKKKDTEYERSKGFFFAPIMSLTRNSLEAHNNLGLWVEPGYNLLFENDFALSFGIQLGGTYFKKDNGQTTYGNHFGIKIIFGKWF